ncbi:MAG: penicillin-binding transpeptidase domain-containing protein [Bacteriovoracia bacterium]
MRNRRFVIILSLIAAVTTLVGWRQGWHASLFHRAPLVTRDLIAATIGTAIDSNEYPSVVELQVGDELKSAAVEYSLDHHAQADMEKLFKQYRPDYGSVVAMDATSGRVLAMVNFVKNERAREELGNLALRATFPSASVFKVVTAAAAIDQKRALPETVIPFNGASHTLYRKNVIHTQMNRWTRHMTLREAFAKSVNTVFGKLGLFYVGPDWLQEYAKRFGFNQSIPSDLPMRKGRSTIEQADPWSLVQAASGYTLNNTMSPLHGALIAAAVVNDGVMMQPYVVDSLKALSGELLYRPTPQVASVIMDATASAKLRALMRETVLRGTSRRAYRSLIRNAKFDEIEFGGKTGSLTGEDPKGKCDWYVGYGSYRGQKIAVSVLTVHKAYWTVKSAYVARKFLEDYFSRDEVRAPAGQPTDYVRLHAETSNYQ